MGNKLIAIILILSISLFTTSAFADTAIKKLGRGIANVVTCPLEFFKGIQDANVEKGLFAAFSWGVLQGIFNTGRRAVVGLYEVITFPIPIPRGYKPILTDPEFFGEDEF